MNLFISQVFTLLTSETGSLTYHLVLSFSIAAAFQAALLQWRAQVSAQARRASLGLGLLLALRLGLFVASGLAWQGLLDAELLLPPLDRAITLLSLLVILWMWIFPEPSRAADTASLLMGLLVVTLLTLGMVWWSESGTAGDFNGSFLAGYAELAALILVVLGGVLLGTRRPAGWGTGLSMIILLAAGHAAHILSGAVSGDFSGPVRLAQIAAYPLLLTLSQRPFIATTVSHSTSQPVPSTSAPYAVPPAEKPISVFLSLLTETDTSKLCQPITAAVAYAMQADICLLVSIPEDHNHLNIECVYNLISEAHSPGISLDNRQLPFLTQAIRRGKNLRLTASAASPDHFGLARALDLPEDGDLLAMPLSLNNPDIAYGVVLLSPYSHRQWDSEKQARLADILQSMAYLLQRSFKSGSLTSELGLLREKLEAARRDLDRSNAEKQTLLEQLGRSQQPTDQELSQAATMAALLSETEEARQIVKRLRSENEQLKTLVDEMKASQPAGFEQVEGELRLALEETARLKSALSDADQQILTLRQEEMTQLPLDHQVVRALAHEFRQPMSSVMGYADVLIQEGTNLNHNQRKLLDRIRVAIQRMDRLVDDLTEAAHPVENHPNTSLQIVDLNLVIDQAIAQTTSQLREKNIALRVDLPEHLPKVNADRLALQQVLIGLLNNAGGATPVAGEILLRVRLEGAEGEQHYVLLQVADEGPGVPAEQLPHVFSPRYRSENPVILGLGDSSGSLASTRSLVEALGGRIWVDSQPGSGATFSVVFPIPHPNNGAGKAQR